MLPDLSRSNFRKMVWVESKGCGPGESAALQDYLLPRERKGGGQWPGRYRLLRRVGLGGRGVACRKEALREAWAALGWALPPGLATP